MHYHKGELLDWVPSAVWESNRGHHALRRLRIQLTKSDDSATSSTPAAWRCHRVVGSTSMLEGRRSGSLASWTIVSGSHSCCLFPGHLQTEATCSTMLPAWREGLPSSVNLSGTILTAYPEVCFPHLCMHTSSHMHRCLQQRLRDNKSPDAQRSDFPGALT